MQKKKKKKKKNRIKRKCNFFFPVNFNPGDTMNVLDIHKYLMKGTWYKVMFGLIKKIFIGLLSVSYHAKCVLLSYQKCMIIPTLINFYHNECN